MAANTENTVLDYLSWRGDLSLQSSAFNEVGGVILARLSYLPFEYLGEAAQTGLTVGEVAKRLLERRISLPLRSLKAMCRYFMRSKTG